VAGGDGGSALPRRMLPCCGCSTSLRLPQEALYLARWKCGSLYVVILNFRMRTLICGA